jgi:hypothetical protein
MNSFVYRLMLVIVICTLMLVTGSHPALAQSALPAGSWQETCRNASVQNNILWADCARMNGQWIRTPLNLTLCASEVWNFDGNLTCLPPGAPDHSYSWTCTHISVLGDLLAASCKTRAGQLHNTSLPNFRQCSGDISNQDGTLTCPKRSTSYSSRPTISFDIGRGVLTGFGFDASRTVYIRVVVLGGSGFGYYPQTFSDGSGRINTPLFVACYRGQSVGISANDNRKDTSRNDFLWSNVIEYTCP